MRDNPKEAKHRATLWNEKGALKELGGFAIECITAFQEAKANMKLTVSNEIEETTKDWANSQDLVSSFLLEARKETPEGYTGGVSKTVAFARFRDWLIDNGIESKMNKKSFGTKVEQKGYFSAKSRLHPEGDSNNPQWSFIGLDLEKYT
ncbi:poxvirus D5 protein [Fructobacillus fructosus KCTC 3544]|nr:poxvirus D5 protein [Fructobacillus fructosus KCTC 3544]